MQRRTKLRHIMPIDSPQVPTLKAKLYQRLACTEISVKISSHSRLKSSCIINNFLSSFQGIFNLYICLVLDNVFFFISCPFHILPWTCPSNQMILRYDDCPIVCFFRDRFVPIIRRSSCTAHSSWGRLPDPNVTYLVPVTVTSLRH